MPRPCKQAPERRAKKINVRVSREEDARIVARARAARQEIAAFTIHQLICGRIEQRQADVLPPALWNELRNISVNLKQLLALPDAARVHPAVSALRGRIQPVIEAEMNRLFEIDDLDADERDRMRHVRVTVDQHEVIHGLARQADKSLSDYAREMLVHGRVLVWRKIVYLFPHYGELKALGRALNHKAHQGNAAVRTPAGLEPILSGMESLMDNLPKV
jgi:predicted HicB family RNase H-like nuclease